MKLRNMIILLTITFSIIIGVMFGVSYAWYAYSNAETKITSTTINETPTIIYEQDEIISNKEILPIEDEYVHKYTTPNSFNIIVDEKLKEYDVGVEIKLINIVMSEELKNANYKYELLENNKVISSGNFSEIGNESEMTLIPMRKYEKNKNSQLYNYKLYIWLSDDKTDQNHLMNKNFSAKINIISAVKK